VSGQGKGIGTGSPLTFRCAKCKLGDWRDRNRGLNWRSLPERRGRRTRYATERHDHRYQYSYACNTCGHTGWSRHESVRRAWEREHGL
jgi:hypothetical protein